MPTVNKSDTIVVTGANGFLGTHVMKELQQKYPENLIHGISRQNFDLMDTDEVNRLFQKFSPDFIIHLAAYCGGIEENQQYPADLFHTNLILMENMFNAAAKNKVKKLIFPIGSCSYPNTADSPIAEESIWQGLPTPSSAAYSMAKKVSLIASDAYRQQYGLNSCILIPGNIYGEFDNYKNGSSHVVASLIRRFYEAKKSNAKEVYMWGTGRPTRDFTYAGDIAKLIPYFLENDQEVGPINLSTGVRTTIKELAEKIAKYTDFNGKLAWDASKPDGQLDKILNPGKLNSLQQSCSTSLDEGLLQTVEWFSKNYHSKKHIRL